MALRRSDLPLGRDASSRFLPWLIAVMVYLAALALVSALSINKLVARWDSGLTGQLTVEVPPQESDEEERKAMNAVLAVLVATPGVSEADVLGKDDVQRLLAPWLGSGVATADLPLPRLIAVRLARGAAPDLEALARSLEAAAAGTRVDDHQRWLSSLIDVARSVELVAALVVALAGASAALTVVLVTRMGLAVHRQVIELLHLIGARDDYVARQFQAHALSLTLRGGLIGLAAAGLTVFGIAQLMGPLAAPLLPDPNLISGGEWALLLLLPALAALLALATARWTALQTLARMP